jgi:DNA-binding NarL/FixJ family response regulator
VQASVELAAVLIRRGDPSRARAVLDRAAGEASRLGMAPFTARIEQLRTRLAALAEAPAARSILSPRELEVARLVAQGLTNKQIGERLFVSERTAENHVQHILVKLGFSSRSQIAAWLIAEPRDLRE